MGGGKYWEDGSQGEKDGGYRAYGCYISISLLTIMMAFFCALSNMTV